LVTIQGTVARLLFDDAHLLTGIATMEGRRFGAEVVVITTGTFLRGRIHIGTTSSVSGGRAGEKATIDLASSSRGWANGRAVQTGTPPRIDGRSVAVDTLEVQASEIEQFDYSWSTSGIRRGARATPLAIRASSHVGSRISRRPARP